MCCVVMIWHCKSSVFICWEWWASAWGVMNAQWLGEGRNDLQRKKYHLPPGLLPGGNNVLACKPCFLLQPFPRPRREVHDELENCGIDIFSASYPCL